MTCGEREGTGVGMNDMEDDGPAAEPTTPAPSMATVPELSALMIHLLKGVLYREEDERIWSALLRLIAQVRDQAAVLLLDLVVDESEGYAFLRSRPDPDDAEGVARPPRLVPRRPLSYPVSLMLALLRKRLAESDAGGGEIRLVLTRDEIVELMRVFLPDGSNEARVVDRAESTIAKVVELGFLRPLKVVAGGRRATQDPGRYEVRRILKAFVDAQWLADFDARLEVYRTALTGAPASSSEAADA